MRIAVMMVLLCLLSARSLEALEWHVDESQSTLGFEFSYEGEHFPEPSNSSLRRSVLIRRRLVGSST